MKAHKEKLEKIKDAIKNSKSLSEEEKSNSLKHIEEWRLEDKAEGLFYEELANISDKLKPILKELGLI